MDSNINYSKYFEKLADKGAGLNEVQQAGFTRSFISKNANDSTLEKLYYNELFG